MSLAEKMKKFFGDESGIWHCRLDDCLYIFSTEEVKKLDSSGKISWLRPNIDREEIVPMCPHHGLGLNYYPDNGEHADANKISAILH